MNEIGSTGTGYNVPLRSYDHRHFGQPRVEQFDPKNDLAGSFGKMVSQALREVNANDVKAQQLVTQAGINPDSVEVHDVMNAIAQSELSLNLTKAITDRVIRAYETLTTMR